MNSFEVKVQGGKFRVDQSQDPNYPGIDVEFIPDDDNGQQLSRPRVLFEKPVDGELRALIWNNSESEDYTDKIVFDSNGTGIVFEYTSLDCEIVQNINFDAIMTYDDWTIFKYGNKYYVADDGIYEVELVSKCKPEDYKGDDPDAVELDADYCGESDDMCWYLGFDKVNNKEEKTTAEDMNFNAVIDNGTNIDMGMICKCTDGTMNDCENNCLKYHDCCNIALANDILSNYEKYSEEKKSKGKVKAVNIKWDVDTNEYIADDDVDAISDYLSNQTGYCHKGFDIIKTH